MNFNVGGVNQVFNGQLLVSGVALQIQSFEQLRYGLNVLPDSGNTANIFIGKSGVTTATGFLLTKTNPVWLQTDSPSNIWAISDVGGVAQKMFYIGF
jgi:hypothetical protein